MSLSFENAPYCKTKTCTNLLTASTDFKHGYCLLCQEDRKPVCDHERIEVKKWNEQMQLVEVVKKCKDCKEVLYHWSYGNVITCEGDND